jgi:quinol monooxygenase YgiN
MVTEGLLVRLEARAGKDNDVEAFLLSALPLVKEEASTTAWFALRFGRSEYGIFNVFPDASAREAHLSGAVGRALSMRADELFASPPRIDQLIVLADKLPEVMPAQTDTKGMLLTFRARMGHEREVEKFLRDAKLLVDSELHTTAWFAVQLANGEYGIFDVFPDNGARFHHLTGHVPRELAKHAFSLLGSMPEMELLSVSAEKIEPGRVH